MGKKGKKDRAGKLTRKEITKKVEALSKKLEEELKGADLFSPLPPTEDCALCLTPLSRLRSKSHYKAFCGNFICNGCFGEGEKSIEEMCPFCRERTPSGTSGELLIVHQAEARASRNDAYAYVLLGSAYEVGHGIAGIAKDRLKALDCFISAVELGCRHGCYDLSLRCETGVGVPLDRKKADLFCRVGAMRGCIVARHLIAKNDYGSGNHEVGIRHWKIAAEAGSQSSLEELKSIYNADEKMPGKEFISKEERDRIYRVCHEAQMAVKSDEREKHRKGKDFMKC